MKKIFTTALLVVSFTINAQDKTELAKTQIVEAACGQCQFNMDTKGCDLAVRINGKSYFVDGTNMDQHGDAHAHDGLCNMVRKAKVSGEIVENRFKATSFELIEEKRAATK